MKISTIQLSDDTKKRLDDFKVHPRETYEDVIKRAITGELYPSGHEGDASTIPDDVYDPILKSEPIKGVKSKNGI